ncbi:2-hydroxy-6-oxo-2-4-heptadienoate hydrolase [Komagataeibacter rhaeticus]|uniref:Alpha/beta fold hydrolase n=1 Tax=Komagataeibacter rhaeticus TaxID=215221 RepID=A0A181CAW1_9PROT|nr:alpha/beta fold hydrolase [Komagataeibacter rhaeticus]ATU72606.1 2-hydroxy-6-oxo-2-4-heptadienoate hydrolase [Komagataeibacter xylinus]EGG74601.1 2-hydroxy-6-oxo-2-4-heptadienoate hydrolase [Gluconacetobacter sp. SXCC-1]KDU94638.1 2-hydroxy-6-oxo-2-4-heptadienoate hydrolase [Komagataeibacter rhaeticus AF1]MBL7240258.1 alpha/beta fold hydrolase [Komagataeibacter rhaeticus]PYD53609.1 2-hydroxy-6-oxo-2-4-heptadienoate hydrolase [Komagataeibacter rhaeticus]
MIHKGIRRLAGALALVSGVMGGLSCAHAADGMQSVRVHGQTIRFIEAGHGPDLVLVHGLGSNARFDWGNVIPELARHYHVLAMDQLGFGQSDKPLVAYGVQTWVDMLDGFLKARHVTHFMLAGESLGGWIAGLYTVEAENNPAMARPEKLVLTDAAGHQSLFSKGPLPFSHALSIEGTRTGLGVLFHDHALITDAMVKDSFETRLAEGSQYTQDSFLRNVNDPATFLDEQIARITVPTLVVWGHDDQIIPLADGQDFANRIKGARLVVIPACGHGPAIEQPQQFLQAVEPFLAPHG